MAELTERDMPGHWPDLDEYPIGPDMQRSSADPSDSKHEGTVVGIEQIPSSPRRQHHAYVEDLNDSDNYHQDHFGASDFDYIPPGWTSETPLENPQPLDRHHNIPYTVADTPSPVEEPPTLDSSPLIHPNQPYDSALGQGAVPPDFLRQESAVSHGSSPHDQRHDPYGKRPGSFPLDPDPRSFQSQYNCPSHGQNMAHSRYPSMNRGYTRNGPIQIVETSRHSPREKSSSTGEQMQMMMMNQMMMQQMAAQQMQVAQMAALNQGSQSGYRGNQGRSKKGKKRPKIDIKSKQVRSKMRGPAMAPVVIQPRIASFSGATIESAAMDNWQEATIILCIAMVGLIYLVASRSTKPEPDKTSLAAKHLVPK